VFGAVNDAVCSIMRECDVYAGRTAARHDASIQAAVDAAAHDALVALYPAPATVASLDASYDSALATLPANDARDAGVAAGRAAAAAMLALRVNDHSQDPQSYTPTPGLGSWVPTPPAFAPALEPGWGHVTPFLLESGSQLRPPPPPAPGSDAYVRDYVESGPFSLTVVGVTPDTSVGTYNGSRWQLAQATFTTREAALAEYMRTAVRPEYEWSWVNAQFQFDRFKRTTNKRNDAHFAAQLNLMLLGANHVLSMIDAFTTIRLRATPNGAGGTSIGATISW